MRRPLIALVFVAAPLATALVAAQAALVAPAPTNVSVSGVELASLDRGVDPCTDFYQFSCGGWIANHPLPADRRSYGRFQEVQDRNLAILRRILESPSDDPDRRKA